MRMKCINTRLSDLQGVQGCRLVLKCLCNHVVPVTEVVNHFKVFTHCKTKSVEIFCPTNIVEVCLRSTGFFQNIIKTMYANQADVQFSGEAKIHNKLYVLAYLTDDV